MKSSHQLIHLQHQRAKKGYYTLKFQEKRTREKDVILEAESLTSLFNPKVVVLEETEPLILIHEYEQQDPRPLDHDVDAPSKKKTSMLSQYLWIILQD